MSAMTEYLLRICVGGICCAAAVSLSGGGAKREITRFCCTCILLILCFSGIKQIDFTQITIEAQTELQEQVNTALSASEEEQRIQIDERLQDQIKAQAETLGIGCTAEIKSEIKEGRYVILQIVLLGTGTQNTQPLCAWITAQLGVPPEQIIGRE